jgi:hypothetical protein
MALPTSGNLSLSQVRTEFGAPSTAPLSAFVRGGAYVPNTAANAAVPTAPPIKLRDLLGASATPPLSASKSGDATGLYSCTESPPGVASSCPTSPTVTTNSVTVTASGGAGAGPSYAWTRISGDVFTVTSPTSASTTFSIAIARIRDGEAVRNAVYRCTVTRGTETATVDVNVGASYVENTNL